MKRISGISRSSLGVGMLILAVAMTLFIFPVDLFEDRCVYLVDGAVPTGVYETVGHEGSLLPGVQVYCGQGPGGKLHVFADVTVDESFMQQAGLRWKDHVRQMIQDANQILASVPIEIDVASLQK